MSKVSYQHTMSSSNNPLVVKEGSTTPIHENGFITNKILQMNWNSNLIMILMWPIHGSGFSTNKIPLICDFMNWKLWSDIVTCVYAPLHALLGWCTFPSLACLGKPTKKAIIDLLVDLFWSMWKDLPWPFPKFSPLSPNHSALANQLPVKQDYLRLM